MKSPEEMTGPEINRALAKLDAVDSKLTDTMIAVGRGHERPSDYLNKTDELSLALRQVYDARCALRVEAYARFGPDWKQGVNPGPRRKK